MKSDIILQSQNGSTSMDQKTQQMYTHYTPLQELHP